MALPYRVVDREHTAAGGPTAHAAQLRGPSSAGSPGPSPASADRTRPFDVADHAEIEPDWIGDTSIMHGESERPVPVASRILDACLSLPDMYCLCGHPNHLTCPGWLGLPIAWGGGGLLDLTLGPSDDGDG